MKKGIIVLSIFLLSCEKRKNWECQCFTSGLTDTGTLHSEKIKWSTEKRANKKCNVFGMQMAGDLNSYNCKIN